MKNQENIIIKINKNGEKTRISKEEYFTEKNIPNYIAELGIIMAKLHYKVKMMDMI